MIKVLHIAAECYPAAKTGGLGDVVGSLPKYQTSAGVLAAAVIPKYGLKWIHKQQWTTVYQGSIRVSSWSRGFSVQQLTGMDLGYPLFVVDISGLFDRDGIYNYANGGHFDDEVERSLVFQQAVLQWVISFPENERPKTLHCHDHHTALVPFFVKHCREYQALAHIPTVFTIHNGQYQGAFWKSKLAIMPFFESRAAWLLEWNDIINPMACAVRCAWAVSTVSHSYLHEMHETCLGLEPLMRQEWQKEFGIINGIDAQVWDPATDPMLEHSLENADIQAFKAKNKAILCEWFGLSPDLPLVSFIGRLVGEKGADILPDVYKSYLHRAQNANFLVLGSGESHTENEFRHMDYHYRRYFRAVIDYNEKLSHQIYAGSDFLIMPSRVEPCGLNQLYSMRYGTIPIVRSVGGLKDTVPDVGEGENGRGFRFDNFDVLDAHSVLHRAVSMWHNHPEHMAILRQRIMALDFSWENTVAQYFDMYRKIGFQI